MFQMRFMFQKRVKLKHNMKHSYSGVIVSMQRAVRQAAVFVNKFIAALQRGSSGRTVARRLQ